MMLVEARLCLMRFWEVSGIVFEESARTVARRVQVSRFFE